MKHVYILHETARDFASCTVYANLKDARLDLKRIISEYTQEGSQMSQIETTDFVSYWTDEAQSLDVFIEKKKVY